MDTLYNKVCQECSKLVTNKYSTSFSLGIRMFSKELRMPIYAIYGFVRFADEIVDTFHHSDKISLLRDFRDETYKAIDQKVSLNPILHAFQQVVNEYHIDHEFIDAFLDSMEMDIYPQHYDDALLKKYIYGSAEVVGLMCLRVFLKNDHQRFDELKEQAKSLGSAFQKINFLRDIKSDFIDRNRIYFPNIDFDRFTDEDKKHIEDDIEKEFQFALEGIQQLPASSRFGVYTAYLYYIQLFKKIKATNANTIAQKRIRVSDKRKIYLLTTSAIKFKLNLI
jgi:phytoene synthase